MDPWPDDKLERQMLSDAEALSTHNDVLCHVRALLARVRELEAELAGRVHLLRACGRAMESMAEQIVSPKTTAEQLAADILGEKATGPKRASR